jgi:CO dehydrogenase maturation factor
LLGQLESGDRVVIADMEAGAGTLTRMEQGSLDVAVLVVEASAKSIDVARRAAAVMRARNIGMLLVAANRLRSEADLELIRSAIPEVEMLAVPDDAAIARADREARSPLDTAPDSPGVQAVRQLAARLERWSTSPSAANELTVIPSRQ